MVVLFFFDLLEDPELDPPPAPLDESVAGVLPCEDAGLTARCIVA